MPPLTTNSAWLNVAEIDILKDKLMSKKSLFVSSNVRRQTTTSQPMPEIAALTSRADTNQLTRCLAVTSHSFFPTGWPSICQCGNSSHALSSHQSSGVQMISQSRHYFRKTSHGFINELGFGFCFLWVLTQIMWWKWTLKEKRKEHLWWFEGLYDANSWQLFPPWRKGGLQEALRSKRIQQVLVENNPLEYLYYLPPNVHIFEIIVLSH